MLVAREAPLRKLRRVTRWWRDRNLAENFPRNKACLT
ncbi:hypothetical protein [Mycolicibacterium sp. P9-22]